ncbi:MAG: hypothetical protein HN472_02725 [Nitrospina sp.]|nr:hypothetical protein [Nitrospina sp.]MBT3508439.1 hypothetical protein [Nitrospina sp.]MBT3876989.1 hypothetical protein [Nitrospina sp.]MBT4048816.1 hypothetical protein [Nitrospina sp.]MBT4556131.1 hypothetical protein [Nitrospina sp.]
MKTEQIGWSHKEGWSGETDSGALEDAQLVLLFGPPSILKNETLFEKIRQSYPHAYILSGSTAGEILKTRVYDNSLVATAIRFENTVIKPIHVKIKNRKDSLSIGEKLVRTLDQEGLCHVFILADGLNVNGSELVKGMIKHLPKGVVITGGLTGDGGEFKETLVGANQMPESKVVTALGFYGTHLKVHYGSVSGFKPFGPERKITSSENNVLYELDGEPALGLYKKYLGDRIQDLPTQCFYFPLYYQTSQMEKGVVRTILGMDEKTGSMTFAGDLEQGGTVQLMKTNIDNLVSGAEEATKACRDSGASSPGMAILMSCIGRKIILKQRVEEEIEAVEEIFGPKTQLTGFYSYGEIAPIANSMHSHLHNQTMSITTFTEI